MPNFDWKCHSCGYEFEAFVVSYSSGDVVCCDRCGHHNSTVIWKKAPGMSPDPMWAGYTDVQLGKTFNSRDEYRRYLAENGKVDVGTNEFTRRAQDAASQDETEVTLDKGRFREAAEKAYNDLKYGNVPAPVIPTREQAEEGVI